MTALLAGLWLVSPHALAQDSSPPEPVEAPADLAGEAARLEEERVRLEAVRQAIAEESQALAEEKEAWNRSRQSASNPEEHTAFGRAVEVPAGEDWNEAVAFGGDVHVRGHVTGDVVSFGGDVIVYDGGKVEKSAVSFGGAVRVREGGRLVGNNVALPLPIDAGDLFSTTEAPDPASDRLDPENVVGTVASPVGDLWGDIQWRIVMLLAIAGAGVLTVGMFPDRVRRIARDLEVRPLRAALLGSLASGFVVVFSVLLAVLTLGLGLPVSLILLSALGIAWLLGFVGLCQAVGDRLPLDQRPYGRWLAFLVGVVPLAFLGSLPWIGWVVVGAASIIGVGGAISTRFGSITPEEA